MARELIKKEIDGRVYEMSQMNTTQSLKTLAKLTKILGEPMMLAISAFLKGKPKEGAEKKDFLDRDIDTDLLAKAVRALIERLDEEEVVALVKKLTSEGVLCDHQQVNFDLHFEGDLGHLFNVLAASLEVQYGNFIDAMTAKLPIAKKKTAHSQGIKSV